MSRGRGRGADGDGVDPDPRGQVGGGQPGVVRQGRLGGPVGEVAAPGDPADRRGDVDHGAGLRPPGAPAARAGAGAARGEQVRDRRLGQPVRDRDVEAERVHQVPRLGRQERSRHRAADVVDHDVQPPELRGRRVRQARGRVQVAQVGGHHQGLAPGRLDLPRDARELVLTPRRDHHVRAGLGQRNGGGGTDATAGPGHDGHPAGDPEEVKNHRHAFAGSAPRRPGRCPVSRG
jgi:hypothetical protein